MRPNFEVLEVDLASNGAGDDIDIDTPPQQGPLLAVQYIPDSTDPIDNSATLTLSGRRTGQPILTDDVLSTALFLRPRTVVQGVDGADLATTEAPFLLGEAVRVEVGSPGASKAGKLRFYTGR